MLCLPALDESGTYPTVSGGGGGAENRNAPNDTAALSFVENPEAALYVFVVVVICDVMMTGRRYHTFELACLWSLVKPFFWKPRSEIPKRAPSTSTARLLTRGPRAAPSTARPLARPPRVLVGWPLPLRFGLDGRLLLARTPHVADFKKKTF